MGCCPVAGKKPSASLRTSSNNKKKKLTDSSQTISQSPIQSDQSMKSQKFIEDKNKEEVQEINNNSSSKNNNSEEIDSSKSERNSLNSDIQQEKQKEDDEDDYRLVNHIRIIQIVNDYYKNGDVDSVQPKKIKISKFKSI